jgi:outer membrane receptor protein involved in Fe transport
MSCARIVFFSVFFSFFLLQKAGAQELRSIKLKLIQPDSTPISAVTALVFRNDSILIKSYVSSSNGIIEMENLPIIPLKIDLTRVGFNNFTMNIPAVLTKSRNGVIELTQVLEIKTAALKEIVVQAKKPLIEQKIDRTILNVDASPGNTGNSVVEVLEKAPGVSVDKDGNISLKGKQAVLVLIDGRQTYLSPSDLFNYLRSLPASTIEQIELMTNPPARYDAAGNAGVINIKTKKSKTQGFNGTYTGSVGQGRYNRNSNSLQLNYRKNKINLFTNSSYSNWNGFNDLNVERIFKNENNQVNAIFTQLSKERSDQRNNINLKLGIDYQMNKKTNFGLVVTGFSNPQTNSFNNKTQLQNKDKIIDSIVQSSNDINNSWSNISSNLYLQHKIDSTGKEITMDIDFSKFISTGGSLLKNNNYSADNIFKSGNELRGDFPVDISIISAKTDFTHPLKNNAKFEAGLKSSYVETNNEANFFNIVNGIDEIDFDKTNTFNYKENINAGYINFNKQWKKWGLQMGLRAENTNVRGDQKGNAQRNDSSFTKSYINLFPTSYLSYQANEKNQFSLSYGKRIDRPNYQSLNPFVFFIDNYTYEAGNPFLQPQITNNIELSHLFMGFLNTTLNYSSTKDIFAQSFTQKDFATIVSQSNIGTRTNMGIAINAQLEAKKIFSTNIYLNYSYDKYTGEVNGDPLNNQINMLFVNINNQFKFKQGWSAELSGWYRTKGIEGQIIVSPLSQVTFAAQKQILKNKGTIKFSIRDIFYTNLPKGDISFSRTEASFSNKRDNRILNLSFIYRFGKTYKPVIKNSSGSDDIKSRVKGNSN